MEVMIWSSSSPSSLFHKTWNNSSTSPPPNRRVKENNPPWKFHKHLIITAKLTNPAGLYDIRNPKPSTIFVPFESTSFDDASNSCSSQNLMKVSSDSLWYESGFLGAVPEKLGAADRKDEAYEMAYLRKILCAKVYDVAVESPLEYASKLSEKLGVHLWLKREDLQPVFSFKLRGAYNMMAKLSREQLNRGVICCSAGNHAQGVALSAKKLGCNAVIAMPVSVPEIKRETVERLGATVILVGESYEETELYAKERAKEEGRTFVPGFDNEEVIAGQGTIGMEIVRQMPSSLHAIFVPVGGGGLIAGIATYVKTICPQVKIIGVEPYDANSMALSLHHGKRVMLDQVGGFAEGVAMKVVGEETFRLCRQLIDGVVLVSRDDIGKGQEAADHTFLSYLEDASGCSDNQKIGALTLLLYKIPAGCQGPQKKETACPLPTWSLQKPEILSHSVISFLQDHERSASIFILKMEWP